MRRLHGDEPRNPFDMTIQENHATTRDTSIISHSVTKIKPNPRLLNSLPRSRKIVKSD